ncbi:putative phage protein [Streptococcus oralis]|uniref:Putative phage protein n=1 Tax=Streptococcus oralis TaxID=1303 RepID=A0A139RB49_STROR|nr:putative phage protein [Streptococcus oralis]
MRIPNIYHGDFGYSEEFGCYSFYNRECNPSGFRYEHTRKELEDADFGWVFDCEGVEVEEVE